PVYRSDSGKEVVGAVVDEFEIQGSSGTINPPTPSDTTKPVVSLLQLRNLADNTILSPGSAIQDKTTYKVESQASDNIGLKNYTIYLNGNILCSKSISGT